MAINVSFDGNSLQTANITVTGTDHENIPEKDAKMYALAHANRSILPLVNYPRRVVHLSGNLKDTTVANLDSRIDLFKSYFIGNGKNLDIDYNGTTRRYVGTVNTLKIQRPKGLTLATYDIEIWCTNPFGANTSATTANTSSSITTASANYTHTYLGTAPIQQPIITITINSGTGLDGFLRVVNNATGQGITIIGQTFVAADVVVIDVKNRIVTKNGVEIDFIGAFPELPPGSQTLAYSDGFTTRNYNITVTYTPLFL